MFGRKRRRAERQLLIDAVEFYATHDNWKRPTTGRSWKNSAAGNDRGSRARVALRSLHAEALPVHITGDTRMPAITTDDVE